MLHKATRENKKYYDSRGLESKLLLPINKVTPFVANFSFLLFAPIVGWVTVLYQHRMCRWINKGTRRISSYDEMWSEPTVLNWKLTSWWKIQPPGSSSMFIYKCALNFHANSLMGATCEENKVRAGQTFAVINLPDLFSHFCASSVPF